MFASVRHYFKSIYRLLWAKHAYKFLLREYLPGNDIAAAQAVLATMRFSRVLEPMEMTPASTRRIVVLAPHPDDEILGAGGTLLLHKARGAHVKVIYLTSGQKQEFATREEEAAKVMGACGFDFVFLRAEAGKIPLQESFIKRVASEIDAFDPDIIATTFLMDDHDDHRRASQVLLAARKNNLLKTQAELWAYQIYSSILPNVIFDTTPVAERKRALIAMFTSQYRSRDLAHFNLGLNAFNSRFLKQKQGAAYAECFFALPLHEYLDLCAKYFNNGKNPVYYSAYYQQESLI